MELPKFGMRFQKNIDPLREHWGLAQGCLYPSEKIGIIHTTPSPFIVAHSLPMRNQCAGILLLSSDLIQVLLSSEVDWR